MQVRTNNTKGNMLRLQRRVEFVKEALPEAQVELFDKLSLSQDTFEQEILWDKWTELFFEEGRIDWTAFAAVPLMQCTSLRTDWFDSRPVWEYLLFLATHVDQIYFFYNRNPGPDFSSEESRWKNVKRREESRPWLRLAFHSFREFVPLMEERLPQLPQKQKELIFKILWMVMSFGKTDLQASTRQQLQQWACTYQQKQEGENSSSDKSQLGLFRP